MTFSSKHFEAGFLPRPSVLFDGPLRDLFRKEELLESTHFRVPDVTRLGHRIGVSALSVDELVAGLASSGAS